MNVTAYTATLFKPLDSRVESLERAVRIERITHHIQSIREDQHAMRTAIERMSEAVTRLALVEERQAATPTFDG